MADVDRKERMTRKVIYSDKAPAPSGKYCQAVTMGHTLYVSGMLGLNPETKTLVGGGAAAEARQAFLNIKNILTKATSDFHKVVKTTLIVTDLDDVQEINKIYEEFFAPNFPARTTFEVVQLPQNAHVEIEVIALIGNVELA